jgi:hypothetical protein
MARTGTTLPLRCMYVCILVCAQNFFDEKWRLERFTLYLTWWLFLHFAKCLYCEGICNESVDMRVSLPFALPQRPTGDDP